MLLFQREKKDVALAEDDKRTNWISTEVNIERKTEISLSKPKGCWNGA